jgi:homocysteine S-methyltransferase
MANKVTLIQGGFADEIIKTTKEQIDGHPLWISRFNYTKPDCVTASHLECLRVGSKIIKSNTYQASVEGYMKHLNLSKEESLELIKSSVGLALKARDMFLKENESLKG